MLLGLMVVWGDLATGLKKIFDDCKKMPHWSGDSFSWAGAAHVKSINSVQLRKLRRSI